MVDLDAEKSALIFIRHGESSYTNKVPDLTDLGVEQLRQTACDLEPIIHKFRNLMVFCSPAARALGSADVFLDTLGLNNQQIRIEEELGPVGINDLEAFLDYLNSHGSSQLGNVWLTDGFFDSPENNITERRSSVNQRACRFLDRCYSTVRRINNGEPACVLNFSHCEVIANYLTPFNNNSNGSLDGMVLSPENGEAVIFQPDRYDPGIFTVVARSTVIRTRFSADTGCFERLA